MASTTWVGGDTGNETDWATGANWSTGSVPGTSAHIVIPNTTHECALDQNRTIGSLTIQSGGEIDGGGFKLFIQSEGDASGGTEHYALKNDGIVTGILDLEFTYNAETAADFTGSSGNFRYVTVNHADADVNQIGAATFTQLFVNAGEFDAGNDGLTVNEKTVIDGSSAGNEVARLQLNGSTATLGATSYTADAGLQVSSGGGVYATAASTVNMRSLDANYDGSNEVKLLGTNTITSYDNSTSRILKLTTGVIDAAGTSITITTATTDKTISCFDTQFENLTLTPASATTYNMVASGINIGGSLTINANATLDTTTNNYPLTVTGTGSSYAVTVHGTLTCNGSTVILGSGYTEGYAVGGGGTINFGTGTNTIGAINTTSAAGITKTSGTITFNTQKTGGQSIGPSVTGNNTHFNFGTSTVNFDLSGGAGSNFAVEQHSGSSKTLTITAGSVNYKSDGYIYQNNTDTNIFKIIGDLVIDASKTLKTYYDDSNDYGSKLEVTGDVTLNGTLNAYSASNPKPMDFGSLTIASGGMYSATSGTTTLTKNNGSGYIMQAAGSSRFTHNNGTIKFDGTESLPSIDVNDPFENVIIDTNNKLRVIDQKFDIAGDLTITSGGAFAHDSYPNTAIEVAGDVDIQAGTLGSTGCTADWEFGSLTIASGATYIAPSGTTTIDDESGGGYAFENQGTFTHSKGKVLIDFDTPNKNDNTDVKCNEFYDFEIKMNGTGYSTIFRDLSGNTVTFLGDLTIT